MTDDFDFSSLEDIRDKVLAEKRLSFEDGVRLFRSDRLHALGALAGIVRRRMNGQKVFYSSNLHLNYTNICRAGCRFCAFSRKPGESGAYCETPAEIEARVAEAVAEGEINEIHIVGGNHPDLPLDYYLEILRRIRVLSKTVYLKAYTASEIHHLSQRFEMPVSEILKRFREQGLDGLPGGGAEIFAPSVRAKICPGKISAEAWLEVHRTAHELGLATNATMLYGHIESDEDRVDHLLRLRVLQDQTGGFRCFVPLAFCGENNALGTGRIPGGFTDLKVFAVSRLLLDNIPHLKIHWAALGLKMGQVALSFGADDFGGTNFREKIMHAAGSDAPEGLKRKTLERLIREAGYEPCRVDSAYANT
jgi:aminodeoxyfutalosine synthase